MSRLVLADLVRQRGLGWVRTGLVLTLLNRSVAILERLGATVVARGEPVRYGDLLDDFHRADFDGVAISDVRDDAAVILLSIRLTLTSTDHRGTNILDNVQVAGVFSLTNEYVNEVNSTIEDAVVVLISLELTPPKGLDVDLQRLPLGGPRPSHCRVRKG
jgi:hypothetical protein